MVNTCSEVTPAGAATRPERTASWAAARVGVVVRAPPSTPAVKPGGEIERPSQEHRQGKAGGRDHQGQGEVLEPTGHQYIKELRARLVADAEDEHGEAHGLDGRGHGEAVVPEQQAGQQHAAGGPQADSGDPDASDQVAQAQHQEKSRYRLVM